MHICQKLAFKMRIFLVLFFYVVSINSFAQKGQVVGKVVDNQSNASISYATISLLHLGDSSFLKGVISDEWCISHCSVKITPHPP